MHVFAQHARREGPERFAEFDLLVHRRLHRATAGIPEDASTAKSARTKLHSAVEVPNHAFIGERPNDFVQQHLFVGDVLVHGSNPIKEGLDFVRLEPGPKQRSELQIMGSIDASRISEQLMPDKKRGA